MLKFLKNLFRKKDYGLLIQHEIEKLCSRNGANMIKVDKNQFVIEIDPDETDLTLEDIINAVKKIK